MAVLGRRAFLEQYSASIDAPSGLELFAVHVFQINAKTNQRQVIDAPQPIG
ncbi:hypothetical protein GNF10_28820 [Nostoc sp. UCD121]|uniref:hypothetical protein n=1 Tax=unclassified Nostoc TaxID=2593658 RepID=UPI001625BD5E|nr:MULTISPECIES: hypothetical protein [unclassified Nostoc]MBC1221965.1 hypothetical protein [Nostoc sp. UCD120]MBC1279846.1 hypothetical protein [Nostoc sp. UCD121]MBC1298794.1 hypothetical protein [Nostoc sp. UCD122]